VIQDNIKGRYEMDFYGFQECARCGKPLPLGSLKYVFSFKVFADYDGIIQEGEGDSDEEIQRIIESLKDSDPDKLEEEVYMERVFLLCHHCKNKFTKGLLGIVDHKGEKEGRAPGLTH